MLSVPCGGTWFRDAVSIDADSVCGAGGHCA